ncbi:MAG: ACP S-malonyltransferase [Planctomycetaceae bacterium]|nr:ACP S-malonyltransferase [Planctomycetaceae bacterium]
MDASLKDRLTAGAIAFRGYNTTNLGRTPELLAHPAYGPIVERHLREASEIVADTLRVPTDLVDRVQQRHESTLATFAEDIALILSVERAQIEILAEQFETRHDTAAVMTGYSLGEIAALIVGGSLPFADALIPLVSLAGDCAALAEDTTMGVVFSRGPELPPGMIERLCLELNYEGRGVIAVSSYLSPNTVLVMGQGDTLDRLKVRVTEMLGKNVNLRKNEHQWPPLHTPILWQRAVPNRAAAMMHTMAGGLRAPQPPVLSLVTGKASYTDLNCRELIARWLDHPQRLWDVIYELLSMGIETVVHIGPDPNLIPATFKRLSDNVTAQMSGSRWGQWGLRAAGGIHYRSWLRGLLRSRVALLRAPFVRQIVVEDWLLEQKPLRTSLV